MAPTPFPLRPGARRGILIGKEGLVTREAQPAFFRPQGVPWKTGSIASLSP
jgi:hypothetical protein